MFDAISDFSKTRLWYFIVLFVWIYVLYVFVKYIINLVQRIAAKNNV